MDFFKSFIKYDLDAKVGFVICTIAGYCLYKLIMNQISKKSVSDDDCIVSILNDYLLK